jgi:septum site-determining protein MinC
MAKANFELKNDSFQLMRVKIGAPDWAGLQEYLADQIEQAPELLGSCLIALDVTDLSVPNPESMDDLLLRLRYAGAASVAFVAEPGSAWAELLAERALPMLLPPIKQRAPVKAQPIATLEVLPEAAPEKPAAFALVSPEPEESVQQASRKKRTAGADFQAVLGQVFTAKTTDKAAKADRPAEPIKPEPIQAASPPEAAIPEPAIAAAAPAISVQRYEGQVRSGQQVYARGRDLVVTGNVGASAEVIADGSIHVYGKLMGKVIAGASGDRLARIYCLAFGAELVSIAGIFRVFESVPADIRAKPVQIFLDGDKIKIEPFL